MSIPSALSARSSRAARRGPNWLVLLMAVAAMAVADAAPVSLPTVESKTPLKFEADGGRPAYLRSIKRRYEPGITPVGELQSGWLCGRRGDLQWNDKTSEVILPAAAMTGQFRALLQQSNVVVPTQSDSIFEDKSVARAAKDRKDELQVGVLIKQVSANLCSKSATSWTGEAYVKLFWQVFAPEQQKVVFEATTEGVYRSLDKAVEGPLSAIPIQAFVAAARNLLADRAFMSAMATPFEPAVGGAAAPASAASAGDAKSRLPLDGAPLTEGEPLSKNITRLRAGVATVFGETGSGTGFFVGRSGWLLTNHHVVGKTKFVKVRLTTGRELVGEVLRGDAARDVALIKTESAGVPPLPVRASEPAIGEEVYALGSPLGDAFQTTLTRGVLSGVREIAGNPFLQSDVAILPGSSGGPLLDKSGQVVGITVMGLGAKGVAGMNFFIPVADALLKLDAQIDTASAATPR